MIPASAGTCLTEGQVRAYFKCSKLYSYGEELKYEDGTLVLKSAIEYLITRSLKKEIYDPFKDLQYAVMRSTTSIAQNKGLLEGQVDRLLNSTILHINAFFKLFSFSTYHPVIGPLTLRLKVSKTPITLEVSGLFRSKKNSTIHAVCFTPYALEHAALNDPVNLLKMKVLEPYVEKHTQTQRPKVKLHIVGVTEKGNFNYFTIDNNNVNDSYYKQISIMIKCLEAGNFYPVLPCPWACKHKAVCSGGVK